MPQDGNDINDGNLNGNGAAGNNGANGNGAAGNNGNATGNGNAGDSWSSQVWQQPGAQPQGGYAAAGAGGGQPYGAQQPYGYAPQPQPQPQQPEEKKSRGWIVGLVAVILIFVLILVGIASCSSVVSSSLGSLVDDSGVSDADFLSSDAVAVIELDGDIAYDGSLCSPEGLKEQLDVAAENEDIKALVLRVNSGGGTATAGEEMTEYLKEFMEETGKPVVVSSASTNASAAYEISSQADYIFTAKSTSIGAIGTALQFVDLSGLYELLGIEVENITSSESKDSTYGTRELTDEEREYYQEMIDEINDAFIENVAEGRNMSVEEVEELATGLTFTGIDAVENGLADEIGTLEDAEDKAAELAGLGEDYTVVELGGESTDLSSLLDLVGEDDSSSVEDLEDALEELEEDGIVTQ